MTDLQLLVSERRPKGERLRCERCPAERQTQPGQSLKDLRVALREAGWVCSDATDADVCPDCRTKPA